MENVTPPRKKNSQRITQQRCTRTKPCTGINYRLGQEATKRGDAYNRASTLSLDNPGPNPREQVGGWWAKFAPSTLEPLSEMV